MVTQYWYSVGDVKRVRFGGNGHQKAVIEALGRKPHTYRVRKFAAKSQRWTKNLITVSDSVFI